jgi:GTP-binding protein
MKKSIVAIVGRPNVGKSTLFNRICKKRSAIVDFEEGVTRDRKYEEAEWCGYEFVVVDTGGIIPRSDDSIEKAVKFQAEIAIMEADLILFVVDVKVGITAMDMQIAKILARYRDKVLLTVNKVDNEKDELSVYDFMSLGFGEPFPVAAVSGRNSGNYLDEIVKYIPKREAAKDEDKLKVAIVGKPNVGKSSIINRLIGENTTIVTDIPGTTRDSIDTQLTYHGRKIVFIDTAGLRKKSRIKYGVEFFSTMRTIESINQAQLVLIIIDATEAISHQDKRIASYAHRNFKDIILVFNKWDLVEKDTNTTNEYKKMVIAEMPFVEFAPLMFVSAKTGLRVHNMMNNILEVEKESSKRIPTSELNEFLRTIINRYPPSHSTGKHVKIYYCTQIKTNPPTFVFFCNNPKLVNLFYRRYLMNKIREQYKFSGATIKLFFRGRESYDSFHD